MNKFAGEIMEDRANILREMKVCRFCLSNEENQLGNIYERFSEDIKHSVPLPLQIMACIAIEVFKNDGMPQLICSTCRNLTMQAYTFKTNCKKADDALKLFLATGQLSKPYMQKVNQMNVIPQSISTISKTIRILNQQRPAHSNEPVQAISSDMITLEPRPKQIKKEDTTNEILTLNIDAVSVQRSEGNEGIEMGEIREAENGENIIEYENEVELEEDDRAEEEGVQPAQQQNNYSNIEQVPTECFPCPKCHRSFPLKQLLDLHLPIHNRERAFQCEECSRKFFTKYDLQKHASTHTGQKPFSCVVCFKNFSRETLLRRHEKTHDNVPRYVCNHCDKTFLTKEYLDFHMDKHKKKRPFVCETCNKSFVFKQGLERHEIIHSQNKPHKCNYCEASFTSAIKLTRHITSHAGLRPYPCKLCGRTFLLSHHLTRHMRSHYAVEGSKKPQDAVVNQHKCDICSMSFRRKDSLINHSAIHSMVNLRCVICNTSFESAKKVRDHITTHLADLPYPCEKCDYSFETSEQLEEHELKHAEMEYEDQIEREVISEALQKRGGTEISGTGEEGDNFQEEVGDMDELEEGEVQEFTITDINNMELAPRGIIRRNKSRERNVGSYVRFLKDELASDVEEEEEEEEEKEDNKPPLELQEPEEQPEPETEPIKPIIRVEGTKVYQRKVPVVKRLPEILPEPANIAPLQQITQPDTHIDEIEDLNLQTVNKLHQNKSMKTGEKVMKGQTFIVTKDEMKAMAKLGILEMKGGQVVLKNAGHPVLNATLKPIQKTDIESILDRKNKSRQQLKQYQKRTVGERHMDDESVNANIQGTSLGNSQLE